jgi:hypothetical protein
MVAAQADYISRLAALQIDQIFDDPTAVRSAIDVVAEEDEPGRIVLGVAAAARDQRNELV